MTKPNEIYAHIYDELERTRKLANDYDALAQQFRRTVTRLGGMLALLKDQTCMHCHGKGEVWVSYAQDDTKLQACPNCKGTGARDA